MLPFCGYNMGDYWQHWIDMGQLISNPPKIFNVNWFRLDDEGNFMWPGFGDNLRVLEWILGRCDGSAHAVESPIGFMPTPEDINTEGLNISSEALSDILSVDKDLWKQEAESVRELYSKFEGTLPKELSEQLDILENNLT